MKHRSAKILATVGPASSSPDMLKLLAEVGVDAFRLNFSHGNHSDHARSIDFIRNIEKEIGKPIAIIADMQGPKLRCGEFKGGQIELIFGQAATGTCLQEDVVIQTKLDGPGTLPETTRTTSVYLHLVTGTRNT